MNVFFGHLQRFGSVLYRLVEEEKPNPKEAKAEKKAPPADGDGPGAGGGYEDAVELSPASDGPGAGGGYNGRDLFKSEKTTKSKKASDSDGPGAGGGYADGDDVPETEPDSDGPGAGGGYDRVVVPDSDGPGAGGGYEDGDELFSDSITSSVTANWPEGPYEASAYFLTGADSDGTTTFSTPKTNSRSMTMSSEWLLESEEGVLYLEYSDAPSQTKKED
jgi:hypothetical protein